MSSSSSSSANLFFSWSFLCSNNNIHSLGVTFCVRIVLFRSYLLSALVFSPTTSCGHCPCCSCSWRASPLWFFSGEKRNADPIAIYLYRFITMSYTSNSM